MKKTCFARREPPRYGKMAMSTNERRFPKIIRLLCAVMLVCALFTPAIVSADSPLTRSIDITVELDNSGGGYVTEVWDVRTVTGTEFYLAKYYLKDQEISDVSVRDETGADYRNIGVWNSDRSIKDKAGKCGLIGINNGYEICWGIGSNYGNHVYTVRYYMTNLVKQCNDSDILYQQFVATKLLAEAQSVNLTVKSPDQIFTKENTKVWGFGHTGDIQIENGIVISKSLKPLERTDYVTVLLRFNKGLFAPKLQLGVYFEEVIREAFEGSSYSLGSVVNSLDITVKLDASGGGYVTELWDIDAEFESVIVKSKVDLTDQEISELSVMDETGKIYESSDAWETMSAYESNQVGGKLGLIRTSENSYDICWSIGNNYGNHIFTVSYYLSNMVKSCNDKDVLYQKLLSDITSPVNKARVTVFPPGAAFEAYSGEIHSFGSVHSFGSDGITLPGEDILIFECNAPLEYQDYLTVFISFDKGIFDPAVSLNIDSDEILLKAQENDRMRKESGTHDSNDSYQFSFSTDLSNLGDIIQYFIAMCILIIAVIITIALVTFFVLSANRKTSGRKMKKAIYKELAYCRDFPFYGSLVTTYTRFKDSFMGRERIGNLFGAFILKWINEGEVQIVSKRGHINKEQPALYLLNRKFGPVDQQFAQTPYNDARVDQQFAQTPYNDARANQQFAQAPYNDTRVNQQFAQAPYSGAHTHKTKSAYTSGGFLGVHSYRQPSTNAMDIERDLYHMLVRAAGAYSVLETKEIRRWSERHHYEIQLWLADVSSVALAELIDKGCATTMDVTLIFGIKRKDSKLTALGEEMTDRMYGFKKYLEEFTIINERDPNEVKLWNGYLIFAQVFGIADEVSRRISSLCPQLFSNPDFSLSTVDTMTILYVTNSFANSMLSGYSSGKNSDSFASSGGGGGFSGGGGGGSSGGGSSGGGGTR